MVAKFVVAWVTTILMLTSAATTDWLQSADDGRVYAHGGRPVQPGEFPFLVLLEMKKGKKDVLCTGSIPSPTTVLTAAHCDLGAITAYAGIVSKEGKELRNGNTQVRSVVSKSKYWETVLFDIMVCHVNQSWEWTEFVAPVNVHLADSSLQPSFVISCQAMGFGQTEPDSGGGVAYVMDQLVGSSGTCSLAHPIFLFFSFWMCSVNVEQKTVCPGDSGGPLLCAGQQWAINCAVAPPNEPHCLPPKKVNVYVRTGFFRKWILRTIKDLPSSADSILCFVLKISVYKVLLCPTLWLLLSMTVDILSLH